ncbi:hypothetical protein NOG12_09720 [Pseudidiomarina sp. GXY010]|uniref:HPr kinase/phosphorylase C-terminal domain-containing protein n=1 Tax=Pseudidiomarina fusca TaxID=2965078 RepID=A0ABU3KYA5_9GAMM|nr:hypothetical protein [Pseudidiomarina sp. GXY010]MDT7526354.1 hypothetical protein [Pseudidiomarina sp. GXY010]
MTQERNDVFSSQVYGQYIESDFILPGLAPAYSQNNTTLKRQVIRLAHTTFQQPAQNKRIYVRLNHGIYRSPEYPNHLFGTVDQLGSFRLTPSSVTLAPIDSLPHQHLISFALGSGLGVQLYLRQIIPMHGMAFLNSDNTASLVFGMSGAGKSTLTAACISAGIPVFSDDILPIERQGHELFIHPAHRRLKLSQQLVTELTIPSENHQPVNHSIETAYPNTDKIGWVAPQESFAHEPARVSRLYLLRKVRHQEAGSVSSPMSPFQTINLLRRFVYRPKLIPFLGLNKLFFEQASLLSQTTQLREIHLPDITHFSSFNNYACKIKELLQV